MIHNARQYRITKAQAAKFAEALKTFDARQSAHPGVHPKLINAQRDALASQLESLNAEINEYERLRKTRRRQIDLDVVSDLPQALIRARIAAGISQRELAIRLGLKEQQIQRYEATQYASASLSRVIEVAQAITSH
jgi:ribosome-binding protein aMBF1 (putative translation factor)